MNRTLTQTPTPPRGKARAMERPHSGKNLTVQDIAEACQTALNFDVGFGLQLGAAAFQLLGGKETIDLEDLNTAGATEHRASLTRDDAGEGRDTLRVNPDRLRAMLDDSDDPDYLTVASLAKTRLRVEAASGLPPLEGHGLTMALGESGLLLLGMADGPISAPIDSAALRAPKDRVSAWFLTEELPVELGWQPASRVLTIADVAALSQAVVAAQIGLAGLTN